MCRIRQKKSLSSLFSLLLPLSKIFYVSRVCLFQAIHITPVMSMEFDPTSTLLATGGSDRLIKLWDSVQQYCTHNLSGHTGVVR